MGPESGKYNGDVKRLVLALILAAAAAVPAFAQDPAVDAFKQRFAPQEQILLALVLADPATAAQFSRDAHQPADPTVMAAWRTRIALASQSYLATEHPTNEKAATVQGMVEPGEWAALMVSLKMLANGGLGDQAKFKIFLAMIDDANDGLKEGDTASAHRVIKMARPKLTDAMKEWLATDAGKAALAAAKEKADRDRQAELDRQKQAELDRQEAERKKTPPATTQPSTTLPSTTQPSTQPSTQPVTRQPVVKKPDPKPTTQTPPKPGAALDQAKKAAGEGSAEQTFDGAGSAKELPVVTIPPVTTEVPSPSTSGLLPSTKGGGVPNLTVLPPSPSQGDDDLAELRQMKKKVSGGKKWYAAGGGALLGGLLGFLLGGPIGAIIGAAVAGGAGYFGGKYLWG